MTSTRTCAALGIGALLVITGCGGGDTPPMSDASQPDAGRDAAMPRDAGEGGIVDVDGGMVDVEGGMVDPDGGVVGADGGDGGEVLDGDLDGGIGDLDAETDAGMMDVDAGPTASERIAMVRRAASGSLSPAIHVDTVMVTYVRPVIGADPAGFFVQAEAAGPALFVAVDPATLSPVPVPGDLVSFDVTETMIASGQHRVTAISSFTRISTGGDPSTLIQDVTAVDLVSMLDAHESELVRITAATITEALGGCAAPHRCAQITTAGVATATPMLRLRTTDAVETMRGLRAGCVVAIGPTPLWRFNTQAQPSAWNVGELTVASCPAPRVTRASAPSLTSVVVTFDAPMLAASVTPGAFTFTGGVTPVGATLTAPNQVTITTSSMTMGATYTVTVASSVTDPSGVGVDPAANSAMFTAPTMCPAPAHLVINEVDYDQPGVDNAEFVEIYNPTSSSIDLSGMILVHVDGAMGNMEIGRANLSGMLSAGGYLVVGIAGQTLTLPVGVTRIDFAPSVTSLQNGPDAVVLIGSTGSVVDAVAYEGAVPAVRLTGSASPTPLPEGAIQAGGAGVVDTGAGSLQRSPNGCDRDTPAMDWMLRATVTIGAANM